MTDTLTLKGGKLNIDGIVYSSSFIYETFFTVQEIGACPLDATMLALVGGTGIFIVGLVIMLLVKQLILWYDDREYKKFETKMNDPKYGFEMEPINKECETEVKNPMCDIPQGLDRPGAEGMDS